VTALLLVLAVWVGLSLVVSGALSLVLMRAERQVSS
jgi:hypothetical protein